MKTKTKHFDKELRNIVFSCCSAAEFSVDPSFKKVRCFCIFKISSVKVSNFFCLGGEEAFCKSKFVKTLLINHCFCLFLVDVPAFQIDDGIGKVYFHTCFSGAIFVFFWWGGWRRFLKSMFMQTKIQTLYYTSFFLSRRRRRFLQK